MIESVNLEQNQENTQRVQRRDAERERQDGRRIADQADDRRQEQRADFAQNVVREGVQTRQRDTREARRENTEEALRADLNRLQIINERQSTQISAQERQDLIREFAEISTGLQDNNRIQIGGFDLNAPDQTREIIQQALEELAVAEEVFELQATTNEGDDERATQQVELPLYKLLRTKTKSVDVSWA